MHGAYFLRIYVADSRRDFISAYFGKRGVTPILPSSTTAIEPNPLPYLSPSEPEKPTSSPALAPPSKLYQHQSIRARPLSSAATQPLVSPIFFFSSPQPPELHASLPSSTASLFQPSFPSSMVALLPSLHQSKVCPSPSRRYDNKMRQSTPLKFLVHEFSPPVENIH